MTEEQVIEPLAKFHVQVNTSMLSKVFNVSNISNIRRGRSRPYRGIPKVTHMLRRGSQREGGHAPTPTPFLKSCKPILFWWNPSIPYF